MSETWENAGFGFSSESLAAAWKYLEDGPTRGPECPLTYDLIELALDLRDDDRLREHVLACPNCRPRFEAQRQAAERPQKQPPAVAAPRRARTAWRAKVQPVLLRGDGGDDNACEMPVRFQAMDGSGTTLPAVLNWNQGRPGKPDAGQWYVALVLDRPETDPGLKAWSELEDQRVTLDLIDESNQCPALLTLDLGRSDGTLFSPPRAVPLDPHRVTAVSLLPGH